MDDNFKHIDRIRLTQDIFGGVLKGDLFEAIDNLPNVSSDDPARNKIVFEILFTYLIGFLRYDFHFSYGDPEAYKPERQRDLEQHIHKLLSPQAARDLVSKVCVSSLHGKGWQTLYGILPGRIHFTLNPSKLYLIFRSHLTKLFLRLFQKTPGGARIGLEIFGLFDDYTPEEFDELMLRIQYHSHHKRSYADNERNIFSIVRLLARPKVTSQQEHDRLVDQIFSIEFTREDIRAHIFAELAKSSDKAVAALDTYKKSDLVKLLVISAHRNPLSMKKLISSVAFFSSHGYDSNEKLAKLERLEESSAEALLQTPCSEDPLYSAAILIATHISTLTSEAREVLTSHLDSPDPRLRYLSACALLQTARQVSMEERRKVFNSIMEIAIGPHYLNFEIFDEEEAHGWSEWLQKMAVHFLLDLAESTPPLVKTFFVALQTTWRGEFVNVLARYVNDPEMNHDLIGKLVDHLFGGDILEFRTGISQICREELYLALNHAIDIITDNELLSYFQKDEASLGTDLIRTCKGYTIRVWACLAFLTTHISKLRTPHFALMAALLALDKRGYQYGWRRPPEDLYVNICHDLSLAIRFLESRDEEYILNFLTELERQADDRTREQIMRSLCFFPRANSTIISLLKKGLTDPEDKVCQAAQGSLSSLSYLDADGVELIVNEVLSPSDDFPRTMRGNLMENPDLIAPSAAPRVLEVLKTSHKLTSDMLREFWLAEYCLNALNSVPQEGVEFSELYKQKMLTEYSDKFDLRVSLRPHFILALGRVRPVTSETLEMLLNLIKPGRARMISNLRKYENFPEMKMAAVIALERIGTDETNGLDWNMRDTIANYLVWSAQQPFPFRTTFEERKDDFPRDPNDAMYQSVKAMASFIKRHRSREQVATQGIPSPE